MLPSQTLKSHICNILSKEGIQEEGCSKGSILQKMLVIRFLKGNLFSRKKKIQAHSLHSSSGRILHRAVSTPN